MSSDQNHCVLGFARKCIKKIASINIRRLKIASVLKGRCALFEKTKVYSRVVVKNL